MDTYILHICITLVKLIQNGFHTDHWGQRSHTHTHTEHLKYGCNIITQKRKKPKNYWYFTYKHCFNPQMDWNCWSCWMGWKSGHSHGARYTEAAFIITVGLLNKQLNFKQATPQWFKNNEHCNCVLKKNKHCDWSSSYVLIIAAR